MLPGNSTVSAQGQDEDLGAPLFLSLSPSLSLPISLFVHRSRNEIFTDAETQSRYNINEKYVDKTTQIYVDIQINDFKW